MWMTSGMAPMMFPGAHQFMPPMALGMNSGCIPAAQGLSQMPRLPYMSHPLPNHIPLNSSPAMNPMNPLNAANQMQNGHLREASNHFLHLDGRTAVVPQVRSQYEDPDVMDFRDNFQPSFVCWSPSWLTKETLNCCAGTRTPCLWTSYSTSRRTQ